MSQENDSLGLFERTIPISKAVVALFSKGYDIYYAKDDNGAVFISNGHFMLKTNQKYFDGLIAQANKRKRTSTISPIENTTILKYVNSAKGNFELSQKPHELETHKDHTSYFYADNKQYFQYDKRYVDILSNNFNRLFVDDNTSYDISSHNLIIKNRNNEVLGVILPISVPNELYTKLADVLPLEIPWKPEIERIKENPTNDPYIGKEFFDGRNHLIVSAIKNYNGVDMYVAPAIENGEVLRRGAIVVKVDEIAERIARWESNKKGRGKQPDMKKQMANAAKQAAKHNAARPPAPAQSKKTQDAEIT